MMDERANTGILGRSRINQSRPFNSAICNSFLVVVIVSNLAGLATAALNKVLPNPPPDSIIPRAPLRRGYLIRVGQSLNLTCPYDVPFYSWIHSDQPTIVLSEKQWFYIRAATLENSGLYVCQAVDGYGRNSAEIAVRVLDPSSYVAQRECVLGPNGVVNPNGPCFLTSYSDRDLNPSREWGDSIVLDCDTVTTNVAPGPVQYRWDVTYSRPLSGSNTSPEKNQRRLLIRASAPSSLSSSSSSASSGSAVSIFDAIPPSVSTRLVDLSQFNEPKLRLTDLNLRHNGEYRCIVSTSDRHMPVTSFGSMARSDSISRTFRLTVKPRSDGPIILGSRNTSETVIAGQDAVFTCEVNPEEHRSSTIRWGKSIDASQRPHYEGRGREVIQWAGGTFVVLPSVANSAVDEVVAPTTHRYSGHKLVSRTIHPLIPTSGAVATEASSNQLSRLLIRQAKPSDAGRYVCSVLTEAGRDDHKFVHISVTGDGVGDAGELVGSSMRRLTVYIAVPIVVFFVCVCVVSYCLVSRRTSRASRAAHLRQRNYYGPVQQTQMKSPSAASSSSVGMCRNGINSTAPPWSAPGDPRIRPSPPGTGAGTATLGYSSTNGSHSFSSSGQALLPNQNFQPAAPGSVAIVPGSYPILLQSVGSQPGGQFYAMQDPSTMAGYTQPIYPASTAGGNEYMLTSNAMNIYPPGMVYPMANGHGPNFSGSMAAPNSITNSSSAESSAITGPGSPLSSEAVDGRLLFQPGQSGQQSYPGYQSSVGATTCASFSYPVPTPQSHLSSTTGDLDLGQSNTPLLNYHPQADSSHGTNMRA
ncbi:hypothetical protein CLF_108289 [Clonorchis sinensis]|uniref:Ig-like domain-containing protein n=1 Tax=Clonorchis sinensis TaxID=79923 RepID=G7YHV3_CLOSI|nr:hypothetical protein CLF_108289 [Clonorchis sinensis]